MLHSECYSTALERHRKLAYADAVLRRTVEHKVSLAAAFVAPITRYRAIHHASCQPGTASYAPDACKGETSFIAFSASRRMMVAR
jgi:hypothetical protein